MPTVKVPLFSDVYTNVKGTVLNDKSLRRINGYLDELGGLNVRHGGLSNYLVDYRVDGLYYWPENFLVAVSNSKIYFYTSDITTKELTLESENFSNLRVGTPVTICTDTDGAYLANGGKINFIDSSGTAGEVTDPDAPTQVTHVAFLDSYILANSTDNKFYWSDVLDGASWNGLSLAQAAGNPDKIVALHVFERQIYLFGTATVEIWQNDGETPFSRVEGGFIEVGCIAPYSIAKTDDSLIWLSDKKYFVEYKGGRIKRLFTPFDSVVQTFADASDCIASRIDIDGRTYYAFNFHKGDRTFAYSQATKDTPEVWEEWGMWDAESLEWRSYDVTCSAYDVPSQQTIIGRSRIFSLVTLGASARYDYTGSRTSVTQTPVRLYSITGWIDFGTSKNKRCNELRFRARRGVDNRLRGTSGGTTYDPLPPRLIVRWRDDGCEEWTGYHEVNLGWEGDNEHIVKIQRTGIFQTRQWEFSCTEAVELCFSDAEQDFEVLSR